MMKVKADDRLEQAREEFIAQWGAMGTQWGINRTMAQIHALLMTAAEPMSTDEVMEALEISRGNAHANLKELVAWGLLRVVVKKGEQLTEAELIAHARTLIAGYKCPKSVDFIAALPRSPVGKVLKKDLREPYWVGHERRVN